MATMIDDRECFVKEATAFPLYSGMERRLDQDKNVVLLVFCDDGDSGRLANNQPCVHVVCDKGVHVTDMSAGQLGIGLLVHLVLCRLRCSV